MVLVRLGTAYKSITLNNLFIYLGSLIERGDEIEIVTLVGTYKFRLFDHYKAWTSSSEKHFDDVYCMTGQNILTVIFSSHSLFPL